MNGPPRFRLPRLASVAAFLAAFALASPASANPDNQGLGDGHGGAFTATSPAQTINTFTAVTAPAAAGARAVTVASAMGIVAGDLVLVWQVQGGTLPSGAAGPVDLIAGQVGAYDLVRVASVADTTLTLATPLTGSYAATGAQVVRVPEYTTVAVPAGTSLTAPAWNGTTGGVVAFLARGAVTLTGTISANGLGGRGGAVSENLCNASCACAASDDVGTLDDPTCGQGRRGEGLDRSTTGFGPMACGVGNRATGGGGGGHINAGGAGGGNGGAGGNGSGGPGGPSVCVYYLGVPPTINMLDCNLGGGGVGGSGGSNGFGSDASDGANGLSEQVRAGM